ncbi:MAG: aspartate aminotransferase family protein [Bacteroidia bacterium]|jgi:tyrosine decarboxylase/aspartate 1-decarboxylase|nr:aspartate aminotransferase family protein [Bacteroidia bacterium]MCC6768412.1 aspartate aminotransferase family protein [Bacteroidia bacterium]
MYWKRYTSEERSSRIQKALHENVDFTNYPSLGYPASKLDGHVFYDDAPFLKDAPILQTYVANPNHIGCHTRGTSVSSFKGTQEMEREVLRVLAEDIFKAEPGAYDGYISPGGTEANIQAMWIYRNYFMRTHGAMSHEIAILASEDTHYSIPKGSNLLQVRWLNIPVDFYTRVIQTDKLDEIIADARLGGIRFFIVIANLGTTMFGSIDDPDIYSNALEKQGLEYRMHVDGAYGGFVYPFSNQRSAINFENEKISSFTIDAHKMLQAPYGTGVFLCRKGLIEYVLTEEAEYIEGMDLTVCGSRSGANAVAVWMILFTYGPHGWFEKISVLQMRTNWLCGQLDKMGVKYFRDSFMNIVTIQAQYIPEDLALKYNLIPQKHAEGNRWYKIVVMGHVEVDDLSAFTDELEVYLKAHPVQ